MAEAHIRLELSRLVPQTFDGTIFIGIETKPSIEDMLVDRLINVSGTKSYSKRFRPQLTDSIVINIWTMLCRLYCRADGNGHLILLLIRQNQSQLSHLPDAAQWAARAGGGARSASGIRPCRQRRCLGSTRNRGLVQASDELVASGSYLGLEPLDLLHANRTQCRVDNIGRETEDWIERFGLELFTRRATEMGLQRCASDKTPGSSPLNPATNMAVSGTWELELDPTGA